MAIKENMLSILIPIVAEGAIHIIVRRGLVVKERVYKPRSPGLKRNEGKIIFQSDVKITGRSGSSRY